MSWMKSLPFLKPRPKPIPLSQVPSSSTRYRDDVHLIPTPGLEARRPDQYNTWPLTWKVYGLAGITILTGIAVEIALALSNKSQGFAVPDRNIFAPLHLKVSFLTSFFPVMFILPLPIFWHTADYVLRWYQPYVVLSQGNARAEESLMMDYVLSSLVGTLVRVTRRRQWIIYWSIMTALATNLFQPLAGALLTIKSVPITEPAIVKGTTTLGLIPDLNSLNAFLAAAGFTEAAAFQGLPDPPFINGGWATGASQADDSGDQSTASVDTIGLRTTSNCASPQSAPTIDSTNPTNFTISASLSDGCSSVVAFDPSSSEQQYGTAETNPVSCGLPADFPQQFAPVMFWFYHNNTQNQPQASAVICRPTLDIFNVAANLDLSNNSLTGVTIKSTYVTPNNVTGDPLDGRVFNAVLFGDMPGTDKFIAARATAVGSQIPGAIFRFASQNAGTSLQQYFDSPDGFLNLTSQIYTQHLAVSAKGVYFVPTNQPLTAEITSLQNRLVVDAFAGHAFASLLFTVGLVSTATHLAHRRQRRLVHLTAHPGTIASIVALTSHSGFGELLYPFDDKKTIYQKLDKLRFSLDRRTGAIVASHVDDGDELAMGAIKEAYRDDEESGGTDLTRVGSRAPLLSNKGTNSARTSRGPTPSPPHTIQLGIGVPYEVEPLVYERSRSASRSRSPHPRTEASFRDSQEA
ncbi:hypothetical protein BC835DRAFT_1351017 [Cytidiella melzeri]|nr:hypothetical protein BC835DRAFT_1351017 [Cytidiella melzeri]